MEEAHTRAKLSIASGITILAKALAALEFQFANFVQQRAP